MELFEKTIKLLIFAIIVCLQFGHYAQSLTISGVEEGPCLKLPPVALNINATWLESDILWHLPAGNLYHYYRLASGYPGFPNLREFEFYYNFCHTQKLDFRTNTVYSFGFGESIGKMSMKMAELGVFEVTVLPPTPGAGETFQAVIAETDNYSYIFFAKCWTHSNQRTWDVFASGPNVVTPQLQSHLEAKAESLGFDRTKFAFLRYDTCARVSAGCYGNYGWGC